MSYHKLLQDARRMAQGGTASDSGNQRLSNKGISSKGRSRFVDEDDADQLSIVSRREKTSAEPELGFMSGMFNRVYASNKTIKEQLRQYEDGSTRAMTVDGKPVNMLNGDNNISLDVDNKSAEGIENFISQLKKSESSGDDRSLRTNKDNRQFGGGLQFGMARLKEYMNETGAEFDLDSFIDDSRLQKEVGLWHIKNIDTNIGKIKNIPAKFSNQNGLRAVAHLGGVKGMKKFISSGGKYNPKDELGTSLLDYYTRFSS
tara:strand:- start:1972 stop:2748 length:777 start_codon:yes stop_codon:yes gene_type:complete